MNIFVVLCLLFAVANASFPLAKNTRVYRARLKKNSKKKASFIILSSLKVVQVANSVVGSKLVSVKTNLTDASGAKYEVYDVGMFGNVRHTKFEFRNTNDLVNKIEIKDATTYSVKIKVSKGGVKASRWIPVYIKKFAFEKTKYKKTVKGGTKGGAPINMSVKAIPGVGRKALYSIGGGLNANTFSINEKTGMIMVASKQTLSNVKGHKYYFNVKAVDGKVTGALTANATVILTIIDGAGVLTAYAICSLVLLTMSVICLRLF